MRRARIKIDAGVGAAVYHVMSRTVNGERILDDPAREVLRKQLWTIADYCGLEIITYAIMSNHFHVLVRIPKRVLVADSELLRRFGVLYPKPTKFQRARLGVVRSQLEQNGPEAVAWRSRQLALMGDVSMFMKLLKQRFSVWFNRSHDRYGTLWSERFKSVLVEAKSGVLRTLAAYIDLNAVRAGFVSDPKDYRFCGYAEAVVGNQIARRGIARVVPGRGNQDWSTVHASYRTTLFGIGSKSRMDAQSIAVEELKKVVAAGGHLPLATVLRCRVRFFLDGAVLGSATFVEKYLAEYREATGLRRKCSPQSLPSVTDWGALTTLRGLRRSAFG